MSDSDGCENRDVKLALIRKRAAVKGVLTKYFNLFKEQKADCDYQALLVKEERLRSAFDKFENLNLEICAVDPMADDFDAVESKYLDTLTVIKSLLNSTSPSPQHAAPHPKRLTKLPQVNVPIFTGKYSEYKSFIGLFDALIHRNHSLESIQKLFYLRNFLQDEPLDLVKNLPLVAESYSEARVILQDRYDNNYKITCDHINSLLDITPIVKSTAQNIRMFVSTVKQQLAALKNLSHNISSWDPIILCILTRKLDMYCSKDYQLIRDKNPKICDFIAFLEKRALALEDAEKTPAKAPTAKATHMVTVKKGEAGAGSINNMPPPTVCILCFTSSTCTPIGLQLLLPELNRLYYYTIKANVTSSTLAPSSGEVHPIPWTLNGTLVVVAFDGHTRARLRLVDWYAGLPHAHTTSGDSANSSSEKANFLNQPWEIDYQETGLLKYIYVDSEPVWSINIKRALSVNFQLVKKSGTYTSNEPCLYAACMMVYTVRDSTITKYTMTQIAYPDIERSWSSIPWKPDYFERGIPDAISTSERTYQLDEKTGLVHLDLRSGFQYKTHDHILAVEADLSLFYDHSEPSPTIEKLNLTRTSLQYLAPDYSDPSNGIRNYNQGDLKNKTFGLLLKIAKKGIDADNIVRNASLTHSSDFIDLLNIISQLNYTTLNRLFDDLVLGTSYDLETSRNIFLEVLPHSRTDACARFIKYLVIEQKEKVEDATLLAIIRKLPFNVANHSQSLLEELEVFTKLGPDFSPEIRHAGIISFATLVSKTMEAGRLKSDYFDNVVVKYFRMYSDCPQYLDRLIWLQGLCNLGYSAESYTGTIHGDKTRDRHERLWAAFCGYSGPLARQYTPLEATLPIITDDQEHIQLRIAALHTFLTTEMQANDFLYIHNYVRTCTNDQLKRFWYTTVRSMLKSKTYFDYKAASYFIPFIANQVSNPDSAHWATNNYIITTETDAGAGSMQILSIGEPLGALPAMAAVRVSTGGRRPYRAAIYVVAEGVTTNIYKKLNIFNANDFHVDKLAALLKSLSVNDFKISEKVHIDIVVKIHEKTVYATHVNQSRFESWNADEFTKSVEDFLRFGSHINQQMAYYPFQMDISMPSELGTPIRLHSTVLSFTSIRGNLTAPSSEDLVWKNDIHVRYQGTLVTSLSTDGPILQSEHTSRIQQSIVAHLPIKCNVTVSPFNKSLELRWPNPGSQRGGIAMHSRTQITMDSPTRKISYTVSGGNGKQGDESSIFFDCEHPMSGSELVEKLLTSRANSYDILSSFQPSLIILNSILLITSPPLGSCGLILPPTHMVRTGKDVLSFKVQAKELMMDWNFDMKMNLLFALSHSRLQTADGEEPIIFSYVTDVKLESSGGDVDLWVIVKGKYSEAAAPRAKNWAVCIEKHDHITSSPDQDISSLPAPYDGQFIITYTPEEKTNACVSEKSSTVLSLDYMGSGDGKKSTYFVSVQGRNLPELNDLESSLGRAAMGKLLRRFNNETVNFNAVMVEEDGIASIAIDRGVQSNFKSENFAWLMDSWSVMQIMIKLGIYRECRIYKNSVVTLSGITKYQSPLDSEEHLLLADCSAMPRFAVTNKDGRVKLFTGGNFISVDHLGNTEVSSTDPSVAEDFVDTTQNRVVKIHSNVTGVRVYKKEMETVILIPHSYVSTACGVCQ